MAVTVYSIQLLSQKMKPSQQNHTNFHCCILLCWPSAHQPGALQQGGTHPSVKLPISGRMERMFTSKKVKVPRWGGGRGGARSPGTAPYIRVLGSAPKPAQSPQYQKGAFLPEHAWLLWVCPYVGHLDVE